MNCAQITITLVVRKIKNSYYKAVNDCHNLSWFCDTCKIGARARLHPAGPEKAVLSSNEENYERELNHLNKLNNELETINNLLNLKLIEIDINYRNILNASKEPSTTKSTNSFYSTIRRKWH